MESIRETLSLYKSKNEELSEKLSQKENELLEAKVSKVLVPELPAVNKNPHRETINKLNETISARDNRILVLEGELRKIEQEWKNKYSQL